MKKYLSLLFITCFLAPLVAQDRADRQYLQDPKSFSMILLGDPQGYTKFDMNQPLFDLCTAWIEDNIDQLNIKAVLCTGDIVEQNENLDTKQKKNAWQKTRNGISLKNIMSVLLEQRLPQNPLWTRSLILWNKQK